jgi:hypothetical protein
MRNNGQTMERFGAEDIARLEDHIENRLSGRVHDFHLHLCDDGLVISGRVPTYYAKQLAQHLVMQASALPIRANDIVVS